MTQIMTLPFKGIENNRDETTCENGGMLHVSNMRNKNGSYIPVIPFLRIGGISNADKVYYHSMPKRYISINATDGSVYSLDNNLAQSIRIGNVKGVTGVEMLGNTLSMFTPTSTFYAIWQGDSYRYLGDKAKMPKLTFSIATHVAMVTTESSYFLGSTRDRTLEASYWDNVSKGFFDQCIYMLGKKGYYVDRTLFRYAFRMFDGSYIWHSPIYYVEDNEPDMNLPRTSGDLTKIARDGRNFYYRPLTAVDREQNKAKFATYIRGFKPELKFEDFDISPWKDLIVAIDVFSTFSIMGHSVVNSEKIVERQRSLTQTDSLGVIYDKYEPKSGGELWRDVATASQFYKIAEYDVSGKQVYKLQDVTPSSLAANTVLEDDYNTHCLRSSEVTYLYNNRLHIANIRENLFKGYADQYLQPGANEESIISAAVYVYINGQEGESIVKCNFGPEFKLHLKDGINKIFQLSPLLMYPDARAFKMRLFVTYKNRWNSVVVYNKSFPFTAHEKLNMAYYLESSSFNSYKIVKTDSITYGYSIWKVTDYVTEFVKKISSGQAGGGDISGEYIFRYVSGKWKLNNNSVEISDYHLSLTLRGDLQEGDSIRVEVFQDDSQGNDIKPITVDDTWSCVYGNGEISPIFDADGELIDYKINIPEKNAIWQRPNVLKVSAVDNPLQFPPKQVYTPGESTIISIRSNTQALSQGQFGQHPLYVFTSEGIWAISTVASGEIAYASMLPISGEVCLHSEGVTSVSNGVAFVTKKGLMLLSGNSVSNLSEMIFGYTSELANADMLKKIASIEGFSIPNTSFKDYLKNSCIGYNYDENEIIVSNTNYNYSYILNLKSMMWSSCGETFYYFLNSYPELKALKRSIYGCEMFKANSEYKNTGNKDAMPVMLLSRAVKLGRVGYKRVHQVALRANIYTSKFAIYVLGTNDMKSFTLVFGKEFSGNVNDIVTKFAPSWMYKFFIIALIGEVREDSSIDYLEIVYDEAFNNRLR